MAIQVTKSNEVIEVKTLCLTIYSQPGLGKTSMAFTASKPLMLDFDRGAHRAVDRKDTVIVDKWSDVADIKAEDVADYDTIILDTVGKALDALAQDVIRQKPAYGFGGALSQQGWGQLGVRFSAFLKMLRGFGKDVILISHMDEKADGDSIKERLKISGGSKDLVLTDSDAIARISISNKTRMLMFSPTETSFGKDPAGLGFVEVPDSATPEFKAFLASLLDTIKAKLNTLSAEQVARKSEVEWFLDTLPTIETAEDINSLLGRAKKAGLDVSKMVVARAAELGFEFDAKTRQYTTDGEPDQDVENANMSDADTVEGAAA